MSKRQDRNTRTKEGAQEFRAFGKADRRREQDPNHCSRERYEKNWELVFPKRPTTIKE